MDLMLTACLFLFVLIALYSYSTTCNYYIKMTIFYSSIICHGALCHIILIPSYLRNYGGADTIFKYFGYWTSWLGVDIRVRGYEEHLGSIQGPVIVVCNHQSSLDILSMNKCWPENGVGMIKKSLMYVPIFNGAAFLSRSVCVDRNDKKSAVAVLDHCVDEVMKNNRRVWIFAEGTRNQNGSMLPFKKGAFSIAIRAQIPIVPIVLSDYRPFYDKKKKFFKTGGIVIAEVLPPVSTVNLTADDCSSFAEEVRQQMLPVYSKNSIEASQLMEATVPGHQHRS